MSGLLKLEDCPRRIILTDDYLRAKMLAAHHLENAALISEQDNNLIYTGNYKGAAIALVSTDFDNDTILTYLCELKRLGAGEIVYVGSCISTMSDYALRSLVLAEGGDCRLLTLACTAAALYDIKFIQRPVLARDSIPSDYNGITELYTGAIYDCAHEFGMAALSILTISENTETREKMEEHERRSRFYNAARLAFELMALTD